MSVKKLITSFALVVVAVGNLFAQGDGDFGCYPTPLGPSREFTVEEMLQTKIPVIIITTENGSPITSKTDYVNIESFEVIDPVYADNSFKRQKNDVAYNGRLADEIRGRGNATWQNCEWNLNYPKKPYRFRFTQQKPLLGMPEARNWVLLAEYRDPSHIFNALAFHTAKNVFEMPFTHNYVHVHLFLNDDYRGLYGLTEHKQVHKNRIDIDEKEGWYVNIDSYYDENPKFETDRYRLPIMIKSPEPEGVTGQDGGEALRFVRDDWNELTNLMAAWDFPDNGYRDLIDMTSLVDFLLVNEITQNEELGHGGSIRSVLAYKDKGKKITFGPVWDFDCGFGYDYQSTHSYFRNYNQDFIAKVDFLRRFYEDPIFTSRLKERWIENHNKLTGINGYIDSISNKIRDAVAKDLERWYADNNENANVGYVSSQYTKEYSTMISNLKSWWESRVRWLNEQINNQYQIIDPPASLAHAAKGKRVVAPSVSVNGKTLRVSSNNNEALMIRVIDVKGKVRASFNARGNANLSLKSIPAGRYFIEVRSTAIKHTAPVVLK